MTHALDRPVEQFSGGMKRRVAIALALASRPSVLLLDEPSCGLGITTKRFVHEAILRVLRGGRTVILTTHDMEEVEDLVDSCCVMSQGEVIEYGTVA